MSQPFVLKNRIKGDIDGASFREFKLLPEVFSISALVILFLFSP